jgi:hypothetical protein
VWNPFRKARNASFPFALREVARADASVEALFRRAFHAPPPDFPRHFVALRRDASNATAAAYVHYTEHEPGVYLCGGLCVDARVYRLLDAPSREAIAREGSLSRWLLASSIAALAPLRAVFAYTGDVRSRRDTFAIGFAPAAGEHLLVQWHGEPAASRGALIARVEKIGRF